MAPRLLLAFPAALLLARGAVGLRSSQLPNHGAAIPTLQDTVRLEQLRGAMQKGDGATILKITDEIRRPFLQKNALPSMSGTGGGPCIFDDHIFSLTTAAKAELSTQLQEPAYQEALKWVRSGGWWSCSAFNTPCQCNGQVRLVNDARQQLGVVAESRLAGSNVMCSAPTFGATGLVDPNAGTDHLSCECSSSPTNGGLDTYHLEKRLSSKSLLQESWVTLLRFLGRTALLPLGTGDRTYSGMQNWAARTGAAVGPGLNVVLERAWIDKFVREVATPKIAGPKCLEWGDPEKPGQYFKYASKVPACTEKYDMQFDFVYWQKHGMQVQGNVVYSDILNLPTVLGEHYKMNAIFATQVFEHLADPHAAAQALYAALAPGGMIVFSAPQQAQFHQVPHDYYRYTVEGVKYTLVKAGFCVPNSDFVGGGDFVFDIARDAGLQVQDFPMEEIDAAYQVGYEKVSHSAIGLHAMAYKPPHPSCSDPTSGWAWVRSRGMQA